MLTKIMEIANKYGLNRKQKEELIIMLLKWQMISTGKIRKENKL